MPQQKTQETEIKTETPNNPIKYWANNLNRHISKENIPIQKIPF